MSVAIPVGARLRGVVILWAGDLTTAISLEPAMKFNGGGHINHTIFWKNLSPNGGGVPKGTVPSHSSLTPPSHSSAPLFRLALLRTASF